MESSEVANMETSTPTSRPALEKPAARDLPPMRNVVLIIAGLMTGMLLGAIDQTIVATAGPTIISDLGGISLYAWVFSAYILTQTVSMPIFGKLSDLYGRKKFFLLGLAIFISGSILSGAAQNIDELIVFRAIQGIGSGAFFPVALAVIGVVFPPRLRGRVQGVFATVFGIAAVVGPSAGTFIVQALNWRWIFYVNLPLGVASVFLILFGLTESRNIGARSVIDWLGIVLLTGWVGLLSFGFLSGGSTFPWYSVEEIATFLAAGALFVAFIFAERRSTDPVLPLDLFKVRTVSAASAVSFLRGVAFYGAVTFIPLFVQAGLGRLIGDGSLVLNALLIPMIVGAILGGQLSTRVGYRNITFGGLGIMSIGMYLLTFLSSTVALSQLMTAAAVMGFGVGITFPTVLIAIQFSVDRKRIGVASSLSQFMGNLGGTIGLAILGTLQTNVFGTQLAQSSAQIPPSLSNPSFAGRILVEPDNVIFATYNIPVSAIQVLRNAFVQSVIPIFWGSLVVCLGALVVGLFVTGSFKIQVAAQNARSMTPSVSPASPDTAPGITVPVEGLEIEKRNPRNL
jgi:EmrB/QacA subfamily drug resistance transporter